MIDFTFSFMLSISLFDQVNALNISVLMLSTRYLVLGKCWTVIRVDGVLGSHITRGGGGGVFRLPSLMSWLHGAPLSKDLQIDTHPPTHIMWVHIINMP